MAVTAGTVITYNDNTIREDLTNAENLISPTETPFTSMICSQGKATATLHQWPKLALQPASGNNRKVEGDSTVAIDTPDLALRMSDYTQISTKVVSVSDTSQWIDGAADIEKKAKQIAYKLKELKTDKEKMLLDNVAASPGSSSVARVSAGLPAFLITNTDRGALGTDPTLSGTTQGYPNAIGTDGTLRTITEAMFRSVIQSVWTQGGVPKYALVGPTIKNAISNTFIGTATRFKDADSKKLILSIDIYESDFGEVQIVPDRFQRERDCFIIDPDFCELTVGMATTQKPLARSGLADLTLIECEYTLSIGNEAALGIVADVQA